MASQAIQLVCVLAWLMDPTGTPRETTEHIAPRAVYSQEELAWFDGADKMLVFCWADGVVGYVSNEGDGVVASAQCGAYLYNGTKIILNKNGMHLIGVSQNGQISVWDFVAGKLLARVTCPAGVQAIGFAEKGQSIWIVGDDDSMSCLDMRSGILEARYQIKEAGFRSHTIRLSDDLKSYEALTFSAVMCKSLDGRLLWQKEYGTRVQIDASPVSPMWPAEVILITDIEAMRSSCAALSLMVGEIWRRDIDGITDLVAVSNDAKRQAWNDGKAVVITSLPGNRMVIAKDIVWRAEGVFLDNGRILACIPELEAGPVDPNTNTYTLRRKSQDVWLIDTSTGATIKKIDAKRPVSVDPNALGKQMPVVR